MTQGMSEEEVKKKLYGEFGEATKGKEGDKSKILQGKPKNWTRENAVSIKPQKKFLSVKSIIILVIAVFALLSAVIIATLARSRSTIESSMAAGVDRIRGYLIQGKKYYRDGLFDEAILTWKNIIAIDPEHRTALRYIRRAELKKKEIKIREEETARKLKEMLAKREKEEKEKIIQEKENALRQKFSADVRRLLKEGDTHYRKGDFPQAIAAYEKVLSLSPGNYRAVKNINRAQEKIDSEKKKAEITEKAAEKAGEPLEEAAPREIVKGPIYTVQVATYLDKARAEELAKKLADQGYERLSVMSTTSKSGRILYEVHLGTFRNKEDAAQETEKIKKEGFKDSFIKTIK